LTNMHVPNIHDLFSSGGGRLYEQSTIQWNPGFDRIFEVLKRFGLLLVRPIIIVGGWESKEVIITTSSILVLMIALHDMRPAWAT